jgi:methylmalonyl-CoA/ethylmalonyl-CoA epimerase
MSSYDTEVARAGIAGRLARIRQAAANAVADAQATTAEAGVLARLAGDIERLVDAAARELGVSPEASAGPASVPVIDHHGIAVNDLDRAARFFIDMLGAKLIAGGINEAAMLRTVFVQFPGGGKLELLQPTGDNPMKAYLEKRGEGIHHMTILVKDLAGMLGPLKAAGYRIVDEDLASPTWREAYISPRTAHGCLVQLVQPGPGYDKPTVGITLEDVLEDRWEWVDQQPRRRS